MLGDGAAVYTPGVSQRRSGSTTYDLHDRLGTASKQTGSSASITATRTYDAFGMLTASTGTPQGPFGFAAASGYQEDGDSGLKLLGHRYYDPSTGRFLTRDPAQDGRNWYAYCAGNPLRGVDPTGHSFWKTGDEWWVDFSEWYSGTDTNGPNGEPVRIGGWHAFFFNQGGNGMTVNGTVHLNDYDDYDNYINNDTWHNHENWHNHQADESFGGSAILFVAASVAEYVLSGSHDNSPIEIDADNHAGKPHRDLYQSGLWPYAPYFGPDWNEPK